LKNKITSRSSKAGGSKLPMSQRSNTVRIKELEACEDGSHENQDQLPLPMAQTATDVPLITGDDHTSAPKNTSESSSDVIAASAIAATSREIVHAIGPPEKATDAHHKVVSSVVMKMRPIHELWNEAYDALRANEENLVKDYEATTYKNLGTMVSSTVALTGAKLGRENLMAIVLREKMEEVDENTWRLKFCGREVPIRDLAEPVVGIVKWADDYIGNAVSANPYASIAWAGVSLLLPVSYILQFVPFL
jgi:hypothetical protein